MRTRIVIAAMALAAVLFAAQSVVGQFVTHQITVNLPFGFVAGETRMAVGRYNLVYYETESVLRIQSAETGRGILIVSRPVGTSTNTGAKLVFRRCDEKYFLIEVHFPGVEGKHMLPSRAESECSKLQPTEDVSVVARPRPK